MPFGKGRKNCTARRVHLQRGLSEPRPDSHLYRSDRDNSHARNRKSGIHRAHAVMEYLPATVMAIFLSALLAAVMSSADSAILAASARRNPRITSENLTVSRIHTGFTVFLFV